MASYKDSHPMGKNPFPVIYGVLNRQSVVLGGLLSDGAAGKAGLEIQAERHASGGGPADELTAVLTCRYGNHYAYEFPVKVTRRGKYASTKCSERFKARFRPSTFMFPHRNTQPIG